jgi:uncharacterized tellurite resistance protein B-like protein
MIWLSTSTVARLRDQLLRRGRGPDRAPEEARSHVGDEELAAMIREFGPICEAMYLMMSADGKVGEGERDVLRGALHNLSGDSARPPELDALLDRAEQNIAAEGRDVRLQKVTAELRVDAARAEVAFVLAAAIAFADNAIADEENEMLGALADGLGIDDARASALLDSVEGDLAER